MYYFYKPKGMEIHYFETKRVFKDAVKNYLKVLENLKEDNIETELTIGTIKNIDIIKK